MALCTRSMLCRLTTERSTSKPATAVIATAAQPMAIMRAGIVTLKFTVVSPDVSYPNSFHARKRATVVLSVSATRDRSTALERT